MLEERLISPPDAPYRFTEWRSRRIDPEQHRETQRPAILYVDTGEVAVSPNGEDALYVLHSGEGLFLFGEDGYFIRSGQGFRGFYVEFPANDLPLVARREAANEVQDQEISNIEVLQEKRVHKPWGHEQWLAYLPNHGALKILYVQRGKQLSLQLHRKKYETSVMLKGEVNVLSGLSLNRKVDEEQLKAQVRATDLNAYWRRVYMGQHWTVQPGEVHRMRAIRDTWILEASTPELDDVVRLQDDHQRPSGRIDAEHQS